MNIDIYIQSDSENVFAPVVTGNVTWEVKRSGSPGKLTFSALSDDILRVQEGNAVRLDVDGVPVFFGFLFERSWGKDGVIQAVAYDQLRYLKNKDSYQYENKTASEVVRMIVSDFNLHVGDIQDTVYKIKTRIKKDNTLFDIILDALDITMLKTGKIYVLYDEAGKLTLKDAESMKAAIYIDQDTAADYEYKASIDGETYNRIKLYRDNGEGKAREFFVAEDIENIRKWGVLQKYESVDKEANGQERAENDLKFYNKPVRSLSIKNAIGDVSVRAGCMIQTSLDIRDMKLNQNFLVESVKHTFDKGDHWMDLTLKGADIFG